MAREYECSEFKQNNFSAEETGEYISAIANSAALMKEPSGFIIWGVDDVTHQIVWYYFQAPQRKGRQRGIGELVVAPSYSSR